MIVCYTLEGVFLYIENKNKYKTKGFKQKVWYLRSRSVILNSHAIKRIKLWTECPEKQKD